MKRTKPRVGFIGIGAMGTPMSLNILKAGYSLCVYNRSPAKTFICSQRGATVAASCAEVANQSDVVITMIGQVHEVLEAILGHGGVLDSAHPGLILIDCSTVGIKATQKITEVASDKGVAFLDAPVSGSVGPAIEGKLTFMVGGDPLVVEEAKPVLLAMGERVYHVGPNCAGSAMKVIINLMIGMTVLTVAETLTLGLKADLDPYQMLEILGQTSVSSPHLKLKGKMMVEKKFDPAFALKYMQKDFDLIMEAAHELKTPLFTSAIAHQLYTAANVAGYGDLDYSSVIKFIEDLAAIHGE